MTVAGCCINTAAQHIIQKMFTDRQLVGCRQVPDLQPFQHQLEEIYWQFNAYKQTIPTMGAIILDPTMEKCLLVRGWRSADGWGFPTGKINKDEADDACAVREARCNGSALAAAALWPDQELHVYMPAMSHWHV